MGPCYGGHTKAELIQKRRFDLADDRFADVSIWKLPVPLAGCAHPFKYRLALVVDGVCVLRYDNEAGKGDHKHIGGREAPLRFADLDQLIDDFWADVSQA
ncbi:hypothetical protein G3446_01955 [Thiorhodococcus minor]|uniref:Uncharacterized protein n=1 Tax=Thiorhodococcus minor TaxID=57489 RepID=A0A6M0JT48_9GAMM|nr:DUF6516 family protein [Thiorhodococcus minor]NEV60668.1 hypothetical protein [Thiorhodococcus minor]